MHAAHRTLIATASLLVAWVHGPGACAAAMSARATYGSAVNGNAVTASEAAFVASLQQRDEQGTAPVEASFAPRAAVLAPLAPDPAQQVRALGAPVPPGLTAARTKERRDGRRRALADLAARYDGRGDVALVQVLDGMLIDPTIDDAGWVAAAAAAGDLSLTRLAQRIAAGLAPDASPRRVAAARRALHAMYGLWFTSADEVLPLTSLAEGPALAAYRERMLALENELLERSALLWDQRADLAVAALADPSPLVRVRAARALGRALRAGAVEVASTADALLAAARVEQDHETFAAHLEALTPALQVRAVDDPQRVALREVLTARVEEASPAVQHAIARCVAALPWVAVETDAAGAAASSAAAGDGIDGDAAAAVDPAATESAAADPGDGLDILRRALERVLVDEPVDADVAIAVLQSLRSFAHTYELDRRDGAGSASTAVLALIDRTGSAPEVRLAAAAALTDLARPDDLGRLVELLHASADVALRYAYAGAIASIADGIALDSDDGRLLYGTLTQLVGGTETPQMRERALLVLDALTADVERGGLEAIGLDIDVLLERWGKEPSTAARATIDGLVRRLGSSADLESLIVNGGFADAAGFGARQAAEVATALAADSPRLAVRSARAMVEADRTDGRRARLIAALKLAVGAENQGPSPAGPSIDGGTGDAEVDAAERASSAEFVEWALELRALAGTLATPFGTLAADGSAARPTVPTEVLADLVDVHVPRAALTPARRALANALLIFDASRAGAAGDAATIQAAFAEALELNEGADALLLVRERARFHLDRGERARALDDFADLFATASGPDRARLLDLATLRVFATASDAELGDLPEPSTVEVGPQRDELAARRRDLARRRAAVLGELVQRADWAAEPELVRADELIDYLRTVATAPDAALVAQARAVLESSGLADDASPLRTALAAVPEAADVPSRVGEVVARLDAAAAAVPVEVDPPVEADRPAEGASAGADGGAGSAATDPKGDGDARAGSSSSGNAKAGAPASTKGS